MDVRRSVGPYYVMLEQCSEIPEDTGVRLREPAVTSEASTTRIPSITTFQCKRDDLSTCNVMGKLLTQGDFEVAQLFQPNAMANRVVSAPTRRRHQEGESWNLKYYEHPVLSIPGLQ